MTNSRIAAFANSLSKILSTKLSSTRREDPLLSRSAEAQKAAKDIVDSALDAKVRKQARQQKLVALEKGRVRDVLVATTNELTGDLEASTASILEQEKRLRKVVSHEFSSTVLLHPVEHRLPIHVFCCKLRPLRHGSNIPRTTSCSKC